MVKLFPEPCVCHTTPPPPVPLGRGSLHGLLHGPPDRVELVVAGHLLGHPGRLLLEDDEDRTVPRRGGEEDPQVPAQ